MRDEGLLGGAGEEGPFGANIDGLSELGRLSFRTRSTSVREVHRADASVEELNILLPNDGRKFVWFSVGRRKRPVVVQSAVSAAAEFARVIRNALWRFRLGKKNKNKDKTYTCRRGIVKGSHPHGKEILFVGAERLDVGDI